MPLLTRRRLLVASLLVVLLLVAVVALLLTTGRGLKARAASIPVGMPREQVEEILGPPVVSMKRLAGGEGLFWVDLLWQVNIYTDPNGRVETVGCVPSESWLRGTVGRVIQLPQ